MTMSMHLRIVETMLRIGSMATIRAIGERMGVDADTVRRSASDLTRAHICQRQMDGNVANLRLLVDSTHKADALMREWRLTRSPKGCASATGATSDDNMRLVATTMRRWQGHITAQELGELIETPTPKARTALHKWHELGCVRRLERNPVNVDWLWLREITVQEAMDRLAQSRGAVQLSIPGFGDDDEFDDEDLSADEWLRAPACKRWAAVNGPVVLPPMAVRSVFDLARVMSGGAKA